MDDRENKDHQPLFRKDYQPSFSPYTIETPEIPSGSAYYFNSGSGLRYEVLFAKKRDDFLHNIINFSVLNEEFDDEYSETNRGEIYRIIVTVTEIIRIYHERHNYSNCYEFSGEYKDENEHALASKRSLFFYHKGRKILDPAWSIELIQNRVVVTRKTQTNE